MLPLRVERAQLERLPHGALGVAFQEQVEGETRVGEAAGGVQPGPEHVADGVGVELGVLQAGDLHQRA